MQKPDHCSRPQTTLKIFGDRSLDHICNTRLRNLKEKTLRYRFKMVHIPGIKNRASDTLSRHPTGNNQPPKMVLHDDIHTIQDSAAIPTPRIPTNLMAGVCTDDQLHAIRAENQLQESLVSTLHSTDTVNWEQVQVAISSDDNMLLLLSAIENGIPEFKHQLPPPIREYYQFRRHLYSSDGVIIYKDRIVIPPSLRSSCMSALHAAHQGISAMTSKAEASIFWPGITNDIHATRANCQHCNRMAPSQAALPPTPPTLPEYPFQCICADYFHYQGHTYLVIVDRYSNWPIVERAKDGAQGLINTLRHTFATYGIPDELSSDGGPEFMAQATRKFLHQWGIHHRLSSVAFPHSNCRAEVGVKTIKRLITGNIGKDGAINVDAFQEAILQYRNTPDPTTKMSPAICVFGRPTKDLIPILPGKYHPHPTWRDSLISREEALRHRHMLHQDKWSEHTKALSPLKVGDRVRIQNQTGRHPHKWDRTGVVIEVRQYHQYLVRIDGSGRKTLRNRKFLRKFIPMYKPAKRRSILDDIAHLPPGPPPDDATMPPKSPNPPPTPLHRPIEDSPSTTSPTRTDPGVSTPLPPILQTPDSPATPTPAITLTETPPGSHTGNHIGTQPSCNPNPTTTAEIYKSEEAPRTANVIKLSPQP